MNVLSATQHFSAKEQQLFQHARLEFPGQSVPARPAATPSQSTSQAVDPQQESESKSSDEQKEDGQQFSAKESIGTVRRILEQLNNGKLLSWLDGSAFDKIQAQQLAKEQTAQAPATTSTVLEYNYRYQEVAASFTGEVQLEDGSSRRFSFAFQLQETHTSFSVTQQAVLKDPLILSSTGQSFQWTGESQAFDFYGNGAIAALPKLAAGQYYLSYDQNQDGIVNSGRELFGPATGHGFAELAALDEDLDGFVDSSDSAWQQLGLWRPGEERHSLEHAGVGALSAKSVATSFGLFDGDALLARIARSGIYLSEQGEVGLLQQVDLNI